MGGQLHRAALHQNGLTTTAGHRESIGQAIDRFSRSPHRSLTHFLSAVNYLEIQEALHLYTIGNPISARLLDGEADSLSESRFTVFELAELMEMNRNVGMGVLLHLFRRIERQMLGNRLTGIYLDEARRLIQDDLFAVTMENWLKEIRNLNGFVMLALQEIEDSHHPKLRSVIDQQCKTKIYLPNPQANAGNTKQAYLSHGLNERQIQEIALGQSKRDYYLSTAEHFSRISLDLEQVALSFVAANSDAERDRVDQLCSAQPRTWPAEWLRERGLQEWAEHYELLQQKEFTART